MKIVTSGLTYLDIDAYAGCIAYAELLRLQGEDALAFSSATINESVTKTIRSWDVSFSSDYTPTNEDTFILVDVSEVDYLDKAVDVDRVEEVIDHHVGYEEYWRKRIGSKANIEFIGAACTQIYEKWVASGHLERMSETSARLLVSGILDNTLNFKARITTNRDKDAYNTLLGIANLPDNWTEQYFQECEEAIFTDISGALINDIKIMRPKNLGSDNLAIGQLVIWDANKAINKFRNTIQETMYRRSDDWFINIVSLSEGKSYFMCSNSKVQEWAEKILIVTFDDYIAEADRLWLRKEVFKQDQSYI